MSVRMGLELGPELVRAVRIDRWGKGTQLLELHWNPDVPSEMVAAVRANLGVAGRLAVTLDLSFLFGKQVRLPPVSAAEKRRIVSLEPERFFPVRAEELVLAARDEDNLVFALRASVLGHWLEALEAIGPVELVEPAPVSLARVLGRVGAGEATILLQEKNGSVGIAEVGGGRLRRLRRTSDPAGLLPAGGEESGQVYFRPLNGDQGWRPLEGAAAGAGALPSIAGVAPSHLAAYGAAMGLGSPLAEALIPADLARRIRGRRRRSMVFGVLACILALGFALFALDGFRSRMMRKLDSEIAAIRQPAESV
ncbi:MAG TPA: hypothetical protein VGC48_04815, partial [Gemmatimonadales bacterium]